MEMLAFLPIFLALLALKPAPVELKGTHELLLSHVGVRRDHGGEQVAAADLTVLNFVSVSAKDVLLDPFRLAERMRTLSGFRNGSMFQSKLSHLYIGALLLTLAHDTQSNPGPQTQCELCDLEVSWSHKGVLCENCDKWFHWECQGGTSTMYEILTHEPSHIGWTCPQCGIPNFSSALFDLHSSSIDDTNIFSVLAPAEEPPLDVDPLSTCSFTSSLSSPGPPQAASSPITNKKTAEKTKRLNVPLRVVLVNCQSIKNKKSAFHAMIDSVKPDVIIGTESWLTPHHKSSEYFPQHFNTYRKDREGDKRGGGVFISVDNKFSSMEEPELDTNCEILWAKLSLTGSKDLHVGAFYRPPDTGSDYLDKLDQSLSRITHKENLVMLGGDFNAPGIKWGDTPGVTEECQTKGIHEKILDIAQDHLLEQVVEEPTRGTNILDLIFLSNPNIVNRINVAPGLGDHEMVYAELDIQPKRQTTKPREILKFGKANWDKIKDDMEKLAENFGETKTENMTVNEMWTSFKTSLASTIQKNVPSRMSRSRRGFPWVTQEVRRLLRKRDKLHRKVVGSGNSTDTSHLKNLKKHIQKTIRQNYWNYIQDIVTPAQGGSNKKFWQYVKSLRKDSSGVSPLKENGKLFTDPTRKADILNRQFKSAFTQEPVGDLPTLRGESYPSMPNINITCAGVQKLLSQLNPHKAMGPDKIPPLVLKELSHTIAPILTSIFRKSLQTGVTPDDWRLANVSPIYKKGEKYKASNYRPVSLTCVCCKVMEHILVSNIMSHLNHHSILHDRQHGFRAMRSCETQLTTFVNELAKQMSKGTQIDVIIMDFSKAFDRVPHRRLIHKLDHYGIRGHTLNWIESFLGGRKQRVLVSGELSEFVDVDSGVPQGSVLGPILFLLYINDLPTTTVSPMRLFADDCILYKEIRNDNDSQLLQKDLDSVAQWEDDWLMDLNPAKCSVLRFTRSRSPRTFQYTSHNIPLKVEESTKYLGLTLTSKLDWSPHIKSISSKANRTLGFVRRHLWKAPKRIKEVAYTTMVRPQLEYCSTVWDPHTKANIYQVERVQRRAARFVQQNYHNTSSVSNMISQLGWESLEHRRHRARLVFMYRIVHRIVAIPADQYFSPVNRVLRGQHQFTYMRPLTSTDYYKFSYFPWTIAQWNWLPPPVIQSPSVDSFSAALVQIPLVGFKY